MRQENDLGKDPIGRLVETPEGMEVDGAEINGWEEVKGDDVNADL